MNESAQIFLVTNRVAQPLPESILRRRAQPMLHCRSGAEAVAGVVAAGRSALVIFEYDLGDMTGPELCRLLRGDPATRGASLLFLGDRSRTEEIDLCMSAGCNDIILRPFVPDVLDGKISKLVSIPIRKQLRTLTKVEVGAQNNGHFVLGHSVDISATGMLLEMDEVVPPAAQLRLHFYLHGERQPLRPHASVVRADFSGAFARYGVRFELLDEDAREKIDRFVNRMRAREAL